MSASSWHWVFDITTVAIVLLYQGVQYLPWTRRRENLAQAVHSRLRAEWFRAMSLQAGSEILAVQTLRNSLMSSTLTASTSALGLMGTVSLAAPSLNETFAMAATDGWRIFTPRLMLELVLMGTLFAALACSTMAVRYYNHTSFISSLPVGSAERAHWKETGVHYLRRAGELYGWGLRALLMVAPLVVGIAHSPSGPVAALALVAVLISFDRFGRM